MRANQLKTQRDHERQIREIQKQHAEIAARQQAEIEHARAEREKLLTEKKYLQHDLIEESERARQLQRLAKNSTGGNTTSTKGVSKHIITTPKKNIALPLRDGFDDDEIMVFSPSKTPSRSKAATPKAGEKRKRKVADASPAQSLQFSQPRDGSSPNVPPQIKSKEETANVARSAKQKDHRFQVCTVLSKSARSLTASSIFRKSSTIESDLANVDHSKRSQIMFSLQNRKLNCLHCFWTK